MRVDIESDGSHRVPVHDGVRINQRRTLWIRRPWWMTGSPRGRTNQGGWNLIWRPESICTPLPSLYS
jgi:hypothetical protein